MTKVEIIEAVYERLGAFSKADSADVVELVLQTMKETMQRGATGVFRMGRFRICGTGRRAALHSNLSWNGELADWRRHAGPQPRSLQSGHFRWIGGRPG